MKTDQFLTAPYSAEVEASVLGFLLQDNDSIYQVQGLEAEAFYVAFNANVYRAIQALSVAGKPFDIIMVYEQLKQSGKLIYGDELQRLSELPSYLSSAKNLRRHVEIMGEMFQSRQLCVFW